MTKKIRLLAIIVLTAIAALAKENQTFTVNGVSFTMVSVEMGACMVGSTNEQFRDVFSDEFPSHRVLISPFYMGQTEVTQELWEAVMGSNPSKNKGQHRPVDNVSWEDCQVFITKLRLLTGKNFRLPTEAEWEFAARGGTNNSGNEYSGSNDIATVAWYADNSNNTSHPVAEKQANEFGLYDMTGNVNEWCNDWYDENYYNSSPIPNPQGPLVGSHRVYRGGSCGANSLTCRVSWRGNGLLGYRNFDVGLRIACDENKPTFFVKEPDSTGQMFNVNGVQFKMIPVEGGTFIMGATHEQKKFSESAETPAHEETVKSFSIGQTEVTEELWYAVMGKETEYAVEHKKYPKDKVSYEEIQEFIKKLNQLTGEKFRLPSEAEWEYAARGGNKSMGYIFSGSNNVDDVAWWNGSVAIGYHEVATKQPNELGLYDMSGNVQEVCQDKWHYYDGTATKHGHDYVVRGGSYYTPANESRVATRKGADLTGNRYRTVGLRLVCDYYEISPEYVVKPIPKIAFSKSQDGTKLVFIVNDVEFSMVPVEGGKFEMGATKEQGRKNKWPPVHEVVLSSYYMGQTEVTQELWDAVMGHNPSRFRGSKHPVEQVSWEDCQKFIEKLNQLTGESFRMPTEAEWEFAARGGNMSKRHKYSGNNNLDKIAWHRKNTYDKGLDSPDYGTHPVAQKPANELGIYDMSGNVFEWCQDYYDREYYLHSPTNNPQGPDNRPNRVMRGGSWISTFGHSQSERSYEKPDYLDNETGLRLALPPRQSK